jgi:hypothetical protein
MKSISSAIVIAAGVYGLVNVKVLTTVPSFILLVASLVIVALGLIAWWAALKYDR